jgi:hypothetical protein
MQPTFDATLREMITAHAPGWADLLHTHAGLQTGSAKLLDSALSGYTFTADTVLHVEASALSELADVEFESAWAGDLGARLAAVNALLHLRHGLPVLSVVILLRPGANSPLLTGTYEVCSPTGQVRSVCHYAVVRVWQLPAATLLAAPRPLPSWPP